MSVYQFKLMLYDTFRLDAWVPPLFGKWREEFKKVSYSQWAIDELIEYCEEALSPKETGSVDDFYNLTYIFMKKMSEYSKVNPRTSSIFKAAKEMCVDILDFLKAMK